MTEQETIYISIPADTGLSEADIKRMIDVGYVAVQTYDDIWEMVRPDPESWDYPAQITRYVGKIVRERDQWKSYAAFCRSCAMSREEPYSFEEFQRKHNQGTE